MNDAQLLGLLATILLAGHYRDDYEAAISDAQQIIDAARRATEGKEKR